MSSFLLNDDISPTVCEEKTWILCVRFTKQIHLFQVWFCHILTRHLGFFGRDFAYLCHVITSSQGKKNRWDNQLEAPNTNPTWELVTYNFFNNHQLPNHSLYLQNPGDVGGTVTSNTINPALHHIRTSRNLRCRAILGCELRSLLGCNGKDRGFSTPHISHVVE